MTFFKYQLRVLLYRSIRRTLNEFVMTTVKNRQRIFIHIDVVYNRSLFCVGAAKTGRSSHHLTVCYDIHRYTIALNICIIYVNKSEVIENKSGHSVSPDVSCICVHIVWSSLTIPIRSNRPISRTNRIRNRDHS